MSALEWVVAVEGPVATSLGVIGTKWFDKRRSRKQEEREDSLAEAQALNLNAEAVEAIATAAKALVAPLEKQIQGLARHIDAYSAYVRELHIWIAERTTDVPPPPPIFIEI